MSRTKLEMVSRDRSFNTPCGVAVLRQHRKYCYSNKTPIHFYYPALGRSRAEVKVGPPPAT